MIFAEDGALEKSTDVTNLLVDGFKISMETTGGDASWIKVNNDRHIRIIHYMVREGFLECNKHEKLCGASETSAEFYRCKLHIELDNTSPRFVWYSKIQAFVNSEPLNVIYTP